MILIFDTFGGLCNQFYDINCAVNFCIINNINFSFRYCSFRNPDLLSWYNEKFENLFDISFLEKYKELFTDFNKLEIHPENTYNYESILANKMFDSTSDILNQLLAIRSEYIIIKQFWCVYKFSKIVDNINNLITPCEKLLTVFHEITSKLVKENEQYNFIHYRYEIDFTRHFQLDTIETLHDLLDRLKSRFKNPSLKIYIATTNIDTLIDLNNADIKNTVITKDEGRLTEYNFEEKAFIDYMIGKNAAEVFGHKLSSFSCMLNHLKKTNNYYNVT